MAYFEAMTAETMYIESQFDANVYEHNSPRIVWQGADVEEDHFSLDLTEMLYKGSHSFIGSAMNDPLEQVMSGVTVSISKKEGEK